MSRWGGGRPPYNRIVRRWTLGLIESNDWDLVFDLFTME